MTLLAMMKNNNNSSEYKRINSLIRPMIYKNPKNRITYNNLLKQFKNNEFSIV